MLGFQTKGRVLLESAVFDVPVEKISRVKLDARLRRVNFHDAATLWLFDSGSKLQRTILTAKHVAVVVTLRSARGMGQLAQFGAETARCGEIHRCFLDGRHLSGRDERVVDGQ